jgi:hypothetical protein
VYRFVRIASTGEGDLSDVSDRTLALVEGAVRGLAVVMDNVTPDVVKFALPRVPPGETDAAICRLIDELVLEYRDPFLHLAGTPQAQP